MAVVEEAEVEKKRSPNASHYVNRVFLHKCLLSQHLGGSSHPWDLRRCLGEEGFQKWFRSHNPAVITKDGGNLVSHQTYQHGWLRDNGL